MQALVLQCSGDFAEEPLPIGPTRPRVDEKLLGLVDWCQNCSIVPVGAPPNEVVNAQADQSGNRLTRRPGLQQGQCERVVLRESGKMECRPVRDPARRENIQALPCHYISD